MTILTEPRHSAEFIKREANGDRSRDVVSVRGGDDGLAAGTILGKITSGGDYTRHDSGNNDGSEVEAAILYEAVSAGETAERTVIIRDAEVTGSSLTYEPDAGDAEKAASNVALAALGIIVR